MVRLYVTRVKREQQRGTMLRSTETLSLLQFSVLCSASLPFHHEVTKDTKAHEIQIRLRDLRALRVFVIRGCLAYYTDVERTLILGRPLRLINYENVNCRPL